MASDGEPQAVHVTEWRQEYCCGIDNIDMQHKQLFELVKYLSLETIEKSLDQLINYVFSHFSAEQQLMDLSGYPQTAYHREIHDGFVLTVAECVASDQPWNHERICALRHHLNEWLIEHIVREDQKFAHWYLEYVHNQPQKGGSRWRCLLEKIAKLRHLFTKR